MTARPSLRDLLNATTFHVVAGVAILIAAVLFTVEVNREPAIEFSEPLADRSGPVSLVSVRATNTTGESKCPEVRIAARDGEGIDLAEAVARPLSGDPEIRPGERVSYEARLTGISAREFEEEFDEYAAYVWEMRDC